MITTWPGRLIQHHLRLIFSFVFAIILFVPQGPGYAQSGPLSKDSTVPLLWKWEDRYFPAGVGGDAPRAVYLDSNGHRYLAGGFITAGDQVSPGFAMWDGTSWHSYSTPTTTPYAIKVGANGNIYLAGGEKINGVSSNGVVQWNGKTWTSLSAGLDAGYSYIRALAIDGQGQLYASEVFDQQDAQFNLISHSYILRWNGTQWTHVGGDFNGQVNALAIDHEGALVAGGNFSSPAARIARWTGSQWSGLGSGISGSVNTMQFGVVNALAVDSTGKLYAGGSFDAAGGQPANNLAVWNGAQWSALPIPFGETNIGEPSSVYALALGSDDSLYIGGDFYNSDPAQPTTLVVWNGTDWSSLGAVSGTIYSLSARQLAGQSTDTLLVGGWFFSIGGIQAQSAAEWQAGQWSMLGKNTAPTGPVAAIAVDSAGTPYAGGYSSFSDQAGLNHVAFWDGSAWNQIGGGLNGAVTALAFDPQGRLYAGGTFTQAGGVDANHLALWDGSSWSPVGSGSQKPVEAMVVDSNGVLYIAGKVTIGNQTEDGIYRWTGGQWAQMAKGIVATNNYINGDTLLVLDSQDHLYTNLDMNSGCITAFDIYQWNGIQWSPVVCGSNPIHAIAVTNQGVVFYTAGFGSSYSVYQVLTGYATPVGNPFSYGLETLMVNGSGELIVGEYNTGEGISRWDGTNWVNLSGWMSGEPYVLIDDQQGGFYAGGNFWTAGGKVSNRFAHYYSIALDHSAYLPLVRR